MEVLVQLLISYLAPLLYILGLTGVLVYAFKKKLNFQFLLPIAIISATLFVYFFTFIFHHITAGIIITGIVAAAFIPLVILDKDRKNTLKNLIFTPGFLIFVLLYTFLFAFHYHSVLALLSDDTMHWGVHVWTMWLRDDFYASPNVSMVVHGDYPPILQLFELIWSRVAGVYKDGLLYISLQVACFAMLFPMLEGLVWKKKKNIQTIALSLLILVALVIIPTVIDVTHLFYNTIQPDYAIAFVFMLGVYLAVTRSKVFTWPSAIIISLAVTFLLLTKQSSILFGGLVGVIYAGGLFMSYGVKLKTLPRKFVTYLKGGRKRWVSVAFAVLLLALPFIANQLWKMQSVGFKTPYCCVAIFDIGVSDLLQVPEVLAKESGNESQQNYARNFFKYALTFSAGFNAPLLSNISYMQFILLFIAALIFIGINYKDKFRRHKLIFVGAVLLAGWFAYCLAIYLTFLFGGMNDVERDNLTTGDRYLRSYLFALLLVLFTLLITFVVKRFNESKIQNKTLPIFAIVVFVFLGFMMNTGLIKTGYLFESINFRDEYTYYSVPDIDTISEKMRAFAKSSGGTYENPKTITFTETAVTNQKSYFLLRYLAIPNSAPAGNIIVDEDTTAEICTMLKLNDYLYINQVDNSPEFLSNLNGCLTNTIESVAKYEAYKIEKDGDLLRLVKWQY